MNASVQATGPASGGARMSFLEDVEQATKSLQGRAKSDDYEAQIAAIERRFKDLDKVKDAKERGIRQGILDAELKELHERAKSEEEDLTKAVFGLNATLESLGEEYTLLDAQSDEEKSIIAAAEDALKAAKERWYLLSSWRDSAVKTAEMGVDAAKQKAQQIARQRLMKADMKVALQRIVGLSRKTGEIIKLRMAAVDKQSFSLSTRRKEALKVKEQATLAVKELDEKLDTLKHEHAVAEEMLPSMTDQVERTALETKISDLKAELARVSAERNGAFVVLQSKEKFLIGLETAEQTHVNLKSSLNMWYQGLMSDTAERIHIFEARLEAKKAHADQLAAQALDKMGAKVDQDSVEELAKIGAASEKLAMEQVEKMPDRIRDMQEVLSAQREAQAKIMERMATAVEKWKDRYGINPMETSLLHESEAA